MPASFYFAGGKCRFRGADRAFSGMSRIFVLSCKCFVVKLLAMKWDVLIIRLFFVAMLAAVGFLLNPLAQTTHLSSAFRERQLISAAAGAVIALFIIAFEMRARQANLRTLIGAATGSILGIIGAYLIGMLISAQDINTVPGEMRVFLIIALGFFMGYIGLMVGAAKGDYLDLSVLGGLFSVKNVK